MLGLESLLQCHRLDDSADFESKDLRGEPILVIAIQAGKEQLLDLAASSPSIMTPFQNLNAQPLQDPPEMPNIQLNLPSLSSTYSTAPLAMHTHLSSSHSLFFLPKLKQAIPPP